MEAPRQPLTFTVRLTRRDGGELSVVERVRSGEKQRFQSVAALAEVIAEMVERDTMMQRQKERTGKVLCAPAGIVSIGSG